MTNACNFSKCRRYRYTLEHVIDPVVHASAPKRIMWIGLNPSTADETQLDPTLRRVRGFSKDWGYSAFVMTNLFAFRATRPSDLKAARDPVGLHNDVWLQAVALDCDHVVAAWGTHGVFQDRDEEVLQLLGRAKFTCLDVTKYGFPKHPLYVRRTSQPRALHAP